MRISLLVLITLGIASRLFSDPLIIPDDLYDEVKRVAIEILDSCPQDDCIMITLGRSPVPINIFIENVEGDNLKKLPLSGFKHSIDSNSSAVKDKNALSPLSPKKKEKLFKHFESILGDLSTYNGKRIKVIDFADFGDALMSASAHLQEFFNQKSLDIRIEPIGISPFSPKDYKKVAMKYHLNPKDVSIIRIHSLDLLYQYMALSEFEKYSSVPKWILFQEKTTRANEDQAQKFFNAFQEKMRSDTSIQNRISLKDRVSIVKLKKESLFFNCFHYLDKISRLFRLSN